MKKKHRLYFQNFHKNFFTIVKIKIFFLLLIHLFILLNYKTSKKLLKVCLCVIGKNENLYVNEFVEHYKAIGYNKIFIYDNNDINGEKFEDVIQKEIDEGFVSIINYRGYKGSQFKSYKDCYKNNNLFYDWLSFFDMDEFLEFKPLNMKIQKFLGNNIFKKCVNIKINWIYYSNSKGLYFENKPLEKRLSKGKSSRCIKSTVRGNLSINYWSKMYNPHTSVNKFISCSSSGKIINSLSPYNVPPDVKYAYLKHFHYKSFEEFCIKIKRGHADSLNKNLKYRIHNLINKNKNNKEKLKIMKKIFKISIFNICSYIIRR